MPSLSPVTLTTRRLLLRPIQQQDAPALFAIYSDPEVIRYWSTPPWTSIDVAYQFIRSDKVEQASGRHLCVGIQRLDDPAPIGTCTVFSLDRQCRRAELGYCMARAHWGNGFMHEALVRFISHVFAVLDLNRIEADIDPRNLPSARSLERLGFVKEGQLRERWIVRGEASDSALYGLLRRDWVAARLNESPAR